MMEPKPHPHPHRSFRLAKSVPIQQLTCFQCHPHEQPPFLVAVGTQHGRVHLVNFKQENDDDDNDNEVASTTSSSAPSFLSATPAHGLAEAKAGVVQTFAPKAVRLCTSVAWNPRSPSQIAVALEKLRSDPSILIYDTNSHEYDRGSAGSGGIGGGGSSSSNSNMSSLPSLRSPVGSHYMHSSSNSMGSAAALGGAGGGRGAIPAALGLLGPERGGDGTGLEAQCAARPGVRDGFAVAACA